MKLRELYLEITNRCQSLCITCPLTFGGHEPRRDMTVDEAWSIVEQAPDLERVVLHGIGEPLLHRDLAVLVAGLTARDVQTCFNTNAIGLTLSRGQDLLDAGLSELRVSIDAARPETYRRIRGVDALDRVLRNTRAFLILRGPGTPPVVTVSFIATRDNLGELPDVALLAAESGADALNVQRLVYWPDAPIGEEQALYGRLRAVEREVLERATALAEARGLRVTASGGTADPVASLDGTGGGRLGCHRPWTSAYVTAHGKVLACCIAPFTGIPFSELVLGDLERQSLDEIWQGEAYERLREGLTLNRPLPFCAGCGERWSV
jgi:MoaA/NifB/PqqE/SkfB family radical SAM enzyme